MPLAGVVTNTPDVLTEATAELALALTLAAARRMSDAERDLRAGRWRLGSGGLSGNRDSGRHRRRHRPGANRRSLREPRPGLGAEIVYSGPSAKPDAEEELGASRLELDDLLAASDVVSVHAPASDETRHLIGAREFELIGPEGLLVNTSRGPLVDPDALADALEAGTLGAAGLDVYPNEPEVPPRLLEAPRCVLLPHIGSATVPSRDGMARAVADNVISVLEGREPVSRVA